MTRKVSAPKTTGRLFDASGKFYRVATPLELSRGLETRRVTVRGKTYFLFLAEAPVKL